MRLGLFYIIIFYFFSFSLSAQDCWQKASGDKKLANDYFSYQMYPCALKEYIILHAGKKESKKYNRRIAQCYINSPGGNKSKAIKYLEFLIKAGKPEDKVYLELGIALLHDKQFDRALKNFDTYIGLVNPKGSELKEIETLKENAIFSKELIKHPVNVTFKNLGKDVNSVYNDKHPFITDKEDFIMFTSDRKGVRGGFEDGDGYVPDVMLAKVKKGKDAFKGSRSMSGSFSTEFDEFVAGGSPDGSYFIYATNEQFQQFDLKITYKAPKKRSYPSSSFMQSLNGRNSHEMSATITNDGSLIIFSSDRKGGYGGFDLWMSKRLPNGTWGNPINMGPSINTNLDENFPNFSENENYITFSSDGLKGMGGFDLFKTEFSEDLKSWTKPANLGHPINSAYDDFTIIFVKNGRYAYKSMIRSDSYGMRDLYRLTFNDVLPTYTVVKSSILVDTLVDLDRLTEEITNEVSILERELDSLKENQADQALIDTAQKKYFKSMNALNQFDPKTNNKIEVTAEDGTLYGKYAANARNGKFIMILEPGVYQISIINDGFEPYSKKVRIYDKMNYTPEFNRSFYLKPKSNL